MDNLMPVKFINNCSLTEKENPSILHGAVVLPTLESFLGQNRAHDLYQEAKTKEKNITRDPAIYISDSMIASTFTLTDRKSN